jgi:tetratricopeptide (TPR) repeat protein
LKKAVFNTICFSLLFILPVFCLGFDESTQEFNRAEKEYQAREFTKAEQDYRLAFVKYQKMQNLAAYIQTRIGECCQYQKKTEDAVLAFRKVQTDYPNSPHGGQAQEKIARAYYQAGNYAKAGPEFEKVAADVDGEEVKAANNSGRTRSTLDKKSEAISFSVYCYEKSGNHAKAMVLGNKLKIQ